VSAGVPRRVSTRELISAEDVVRAKSATTAYDLVAQLRPAFLQSRGPTSLLLATPTLPDVSIDGGRAEQIDVMRSINARDVVDIQLLDRWKAEQLLGGAHGAGTILVRLRRSR
jgi:hypothetical protein